MSEHYYRNLEFLNIIEMNKIRFLTLWLTVYMDAYDYFILIIVVGKTTAVEMLSSIAYAL